jgi:hypothetical protein
MGCSIGSWIGQRDRWFAGLVFSTGFQHGVWWYARGANGMDRDGFVHFLVDMDEATSGDEFDRGNRISCELEKGRFTNRTFVLFCVDKKWAMMSRPFLLFQFCRCGCSSWWIVCFHFFRHQKCNGAALMSIHDQVHVMIRTIIIHCN